MAIHLIHGCASEFKPGRQAFRNYVPEATLARHLEMLPARYGDWTEREERDVLTIDDATAGAGRAARIARDFGHRVTLFVNPHQIIQRQPYYFSWLNHYLDARQTSHATYLGVRYDLPRDVRAFRIAVKGVLSRLAPDDALDAVHELGRTLGCGPDQLAEHARPLSIDELIALRDLGVSIENHGWGHQRIDAMSAEELQTDIARSARWLGAVVGTRSSLYAVPFGEAGRHEGTLETVPSAVLLADGRLPSGRIGRNSWNRVDITARLQHALTEER